MLVILTFVLEQLLYWGCVFIYLSYVLSGFGCEECLK